MEREVTSIYLFSSIETKELLAIPENEVVIEIDEDDNGNLRVKTRRK